MRPAWLRETPAGAPAPPAAAGGRASDGQAGERHVEQRPAAVVASAGGAAARATTGPVVRTGRPALSVVRGPAGADAAAAARPSPIRASVPAPARPLAASGAADAGGARVIRASAGVHPRAEDAPRRDAEDDAVARPGLPTAERGAAGAAPPPANGAPMRGRAPEEDDVSLLEPWEDPRAGRRRRGGERTLDRLLRRVSGARLAYGKPIRAGERTVVPVARFRAAGGGGFGGDEERGGGGGGVMRADPIGFIDIAADGARYRPIVDRTKVARAVVSASVAGTAVAAAVLKRSGAAAAAEPAVRRGLRRLLRRD